MLHVTGVQEVRGFQAIISPHFRGQMLSTSIENRIQICDALVENAFFELSRLSETHRFTPNFGGWRIFRQVVGVPA